MPGEGLAESDIGLLVQKALGDTDLSVISIEKIGRPYSTIWLVAVERNGRQETYVAKHIRDHPERDYDLSQRADHIFHDDPSYMRLDAHFDAAQGFIISRYSDLPSLQNTLIKDGWPNPISWFRQVDRCVGLAGKWLNRYHSFETTTGPLSPALVKYLENRASGLEQLPRQTRDQLISAAKACAEGTLTIPHCDFAPQNILSDGERISIIDFGVAEWVHMSPYWDIATFTIDLKAHARFRRKSPLHWIPHLHSRLTSSFLSGYGLGQLPDDREWHLCVAVRYLALFTGAVGRDRTKAAWYRRNLEQSLTRFSQCPI